MHDHAGGHAHQQNAGLVRIVDDFRGIYYMGRSIRDIQPGLFAADERAGEDPVPLARLEEYPRAKRGGAARKTDGGNPRGGSMCVNEYWSRKARAITTTSARAWQTCCRPGRLPSLRLIGLARVRWWR